MMTKSFELELYEDNIYRLVNEKAKLLCKEFVEFVFERTPSKIIITASTEPLETKVVVEITKGGYYRWWWQFEEGYYRFFNTRYGMHPAMEEILKDFFPDAREDGLDEPKKLWILIKEV